MFLAMNDEGLIFLVVLAGVGGFIAVTAIVFTSVRRVFESRHRERSRSEIAAYIAEGSMTAEEGERILKIGQPQPEDED
ncbi:MAG: hypothetical protein AAGI53_07245 [Planctomycetota bacterium]